MFRGIRRLISNLLNSINRPRIIRRNRLILVGYIYCLAHCLHWSDEDGVGNVLDVTLGSLWLHHGHSWLLHAHLVRNVDEILSELETVILSLLDESPLVN